MPYTCLLLDVYCVTRLVCVVQRIVRMNKTEDDELDAEELTDEELKQVAGHLRLLSLVAVDWLRLALCGLRGVIV